MKPCNADPPCGRCSTCRARAAHARAVDLPDGRGTEWGIYTSAPLRDLATRLAAERGMSRSALAAEALKIGLFHVMKGGLLREGPKS